MVKRVLIGLVFLLSATTAMAQTSLLPDLQQLRTEYPTTMSRDQVGEYLNRVAWKHRAEGWGLLIKTGGNRCPAPQGVEISCDILVYAPTAWHFDVLSDAGGASIPQWQDDGPCDPSVSGCDMARFLAPIRPAQDRGENGSDYNQDGTPDLIWQNDATRQVTMWYMTSASGNVLGAWDWVSSAGIPGWRVAATGDFNSDSKPDLVWVNDTTRQVTVWYMGANLGNVMLGWNWLSSAGFPGWHIMAVADFNGDGKPDIVGQNDTTHQVTIVYMGGAEGNVTQGWDWVSQTGIPGWSVVAARDFNGDGKPDLVWQNDTTHQVTVWYMGGAGGNILQGWNYLSSSEIPGWRVIGARDFNGDGTPDLVWQNDATRQVTVWYMGGPQGNVFLGWAYISSASIPGWTAMVR